ncbi:MAG: hypothetical protein R2792_00635 [Saprospiraceae bacterium]
MSPTICLEFVTQDQIALQLTINTLPLVNAGPDKEICIGDNLDLTSLGAEVIDNGSGVSGGEWSSSVNGDIYSKYFPWLLLRSTSQAGGLQQ